MYANIVLWSIFKTYSLPALLAIISLNCFAQDVSYLEGMPKSNTALKNIKGANNVDTYVKQEAACEMLQEMVAVMSGKLQGNQITFDEELLMKHYGYEAEKLRQQYQKERGPKEQWLKAINKYRSDDKLKAEVASLLTPGARAYYVKKKNEYDNYLSGQKKKQPSTVNNTEERNPQPANSITLDEVDLHAMMPGGKWFLIDCEKNIKPSAFLCRKICLYNKIEDTGNVKKSQNVSAYLLVKIVESSYKQDASSVLLGETIGQTIGSAAGISIPSQQEKMKQNINTVMKYENNMPVETNADYSVKNMSDVLRPAGNNDALVYEVISNNNKNAFGGPRSGYSIGFMKGGYIVCIAISCPAGEFAANKDEFIAIIKSISSVKHSKSNTNASSLLPKLPAGAVCPFLPVCDGYTYSYTKQDPYLKSTLTHTAEYEKAEDKIVKGKRFKGFRITSTSPDENKHTVFYNYESGVLTTHTEQTNYLGEPNATFTTVAELKTNLAEGGTWTDNIIMEGGSKTIKSTILEKDVTVVIDGKSYDFVTIVERRITAIPITGRSIESIQKVYYAKGIGKIKAEDGYAGGDVFATVMTSYSIPGQ